MVLSDLPIMVWIPPECCTMSRPVPFFLASLKLKSMDVRRTSASIGWECGMLLVTGLAPASPRQKDHPVHRYWDVGVRSGVALVHVVAAIPVEAMLPVRMMAASE